MLLKRLVQLGLKSMYSSFKSNKISIVHAFIALGCLLGLALAVLLVAIPVFVFKKVVCFLNKL